MCLVVCRTVGAGRGAEEVEEAVQPLITAIKGQEDGTEGQGQSKEEHYVLLCRLLRPAEEGGGVAQEAFELGRGQAAHGLHAVGQRRQAEQAHRQHAVKSRSLGGRG